MFVFDRCNFRSDAEFSPFSNAVWIDEYIHTCRQ